MQRGFDPEVFKTGGQPNGAQSNGGGFDPDVFHADPHQFQMPEPVPEKPSAGTGSAAGDVATAFATGSNKGGLRLLGLPMDTIANVFELTKAALGAPYIAVTGKPPPDFLSPRERSTVPLSGDWLIAQLAHSKYGRPLVVAPNPDYEGGHIQNVGGAVTGSLAGPQTRIQALNNIALNTAGSTIGKYVYDKTGSAAGAVLGSLLPVAGQTAAVELAKRAVRGGEAGRQEMESRVRTLENAGIDNPTLGLASGNRMLGGFENLMLSTPGAIKTMGRAREGALAGMQRKVSDAADRAAPVRGADVAGGAIAKDLKGSFVDAYKAGQRDLYARLDQLIPGNRPTLVSNTEDALNALTQGIEGAPNIGNRFINPRIKEIKTAFDQDVGTVPRVAPGTISVPAREALPGATYAGLGVQPPPPVPGVRLPAQSYAIPPGAVVEPASPFSGVGVGTRGAERAIPGRVEQIPGRNSSATGPFSGVGLAPQPPEQPLSLPGYSYQTAATGRRVSPLNVAGGNQPLLPPELPYTAVKRLRSQVGEELSNASLAPDVPTSQWKRLYAGLSEDLGGAAAAAGPQAEQAWKRANQYTKAGAARLERVGPFANTETSTERPFTSLMNTTRENTSTLQAVKKSVSPETRAIVAGTVIERLGRANPGNQNDLGDVFSHERFLTNWNSMTPKARRELFSGFKDADAIRAEVEAVAKAASMMRDSSKLWANPSGTAANTAARGAIMGLLGGTGGAAAGLFSPVVPASIAGGLLGTRWMAGLLTSPVVRSEMMRRTLFEPHLIGGLAGSLQSGGLHEQAE